MEDAEVLKELYETIKQNSKADYAGIIEQRASYPYLYHLSQIRENLVSFLPFDKDMRVLECNPECGALTRVCGNDFYDCRYTASESRFL